MSAKRVYWIVCSSVLAMSLCAAAASPWLGYAFNLTHSLPGTFYVIHKGGKIKKGDLIAFRWKGGATYPMGTLFIKRVAGVAGDVVKRVGHVFWVGDQYIGIAQSFSKAGVPLYPAAGGVIGIGAYFVATSNPDSLDSRYALAGNVKETEVIGKAYEIF